MEYAWVAVRDEEVEAVLMESRLGVRPPDAPVPEAMAGTLLGSVFASLVRMNEGARHTALRQQVEARLAQWDAETLERITAAAVKRVSRDDLAGCVVGTLIGLPSPENLLPEIRAFAAAVAAGATKESIMRGIPAAQTLFAALPAGDFDERANLLGFLFQSYAATAKLIANCLEGRTDAPVPLTRRWAAQELEICGARMQKGDALIVLLASPRFHFGAGRHKCPGQRIAQTIARAAVRAIRSTED